MLAFQVLNQMFPQFSPNFAEKSMITMKKGNIIKALGRNISSIHFMSLNFHEPYLFGKIVFSPPNTIILIMISTCRLKLYGLILAKNQ